MKHRVELDVITPDEFLDVVNKSREWFNTKEAGRYSSCSAGTIRRACEAGELVGYQVKPRGRWRIHRADLDAWIRGTVATGTGAVA